MSADNTFWGDVVNGRVTVVQDTNQPVGRVDRHGTQVYVHPDTYAAFMAAAQSLDAKITGVAR